MAVTLELSSEEAKFVGDLLDWWEAGIDEAVELTTNDRTINDVEQLTDLVSGLTGQRSACSSIREKLTRHGVVT